MTEIYLHIDARMDDYIRTHLEVPPLADSTHEQVHQARCIGRCAALIGVRLRHGTVDTAMPITIGQVPVAETSCLDLCVYD